MRAREDLLLCQEEAAVIQQWWANGGTEEIDRIDPQCETEAGGLIGPFTFKEIADFYSRVMLILGWRIKPIQLWLLDKQGTMSFADTWKAFEREENG